MRTVRPEIAFVLHGHPIKESADKQQAENIKERQPNHGQEHLKNL